MHVYSDIHPHHYIVEQLQSLLGNKRCFDKLHRLPKPDLTVGESSGNCAELHHNLLWRPPILNA